MYMKAVNYNQPKLSKRMIVFIIPFFIDALLYLNLQTLRINPVFQCFSRQLLLPIMHIYIRHGFHVSLRLYTETSILKDENFNKLKAESEQKEQAASLALSRAQEALSQAQATNALEIASLKAAAEHAAAEAASALESMQSALSEAEAENKTLSALNTTLQEKVVQVEASLTAAMQEALSQARSQSAMEIASLKADAEEAASKAANALSAERGSLALLEAELAALVELHAAAEKKVFVYELKARISGIAFCPL